MLDDNGAINFNHIELFRERVLELWTSNLLRNKMEEKKVQMPLKAIDIRSIRPSHESVLNECMESTVSMLEENTSLTSLVLSNFPEAIPLEPSILRQIAPKCLSLENLTVNKMKLAHPQTWLAMAELLEAIFDEMNSATDCKLKTLNM